MTRMHLGWLIALAACADSNADTVKDPFAKPPPAASLTVELAAVSLADDCAPLPPPPTAPAPATPAKPADAGPSAPMRRAPGAQAVGGRYGCDQTTMQLKITTPAGFKAGTVKIKKVELLDTEGKVLQTLSSRNPRAWKNTTSYLPWDEKVGPSQGVHSMYDLSSPDWSKLTGSRWNAHTKTFQVRVVVEIGGANKTVTKSAITPARLPPPVPT
jgi:hypothetical protein